MGNKEDFINVKAGDENCPADALMENFRKRIHSTSSNYPKNIEFSENSINFFRNMADITEESEQHIKFCWFEISDQELPPLIIKIRKYKGKYYLQFLKELGEEKLIIKGKQRKGKNKNGKIEIDKEKER